MMGLVVWLHWSCMPAGIRRVTSLNSTQRPLLPCAGSWWRVSSAKTGLWRVN